jgi:glucosamine--fructose-6-phosphate aminotransferase (isomerizing)
MEAQTQPATPKWIGGVEPPAELLKASGIEILEIECRQQPGKLRELIAAYGEDAAIRAELRALRGLAANPGPVLLLGMGASYCSAITGSIHLRSHGRSSYALDAGEWLHYGVPSWGDAALSVLLTTSGESAELVELMKAGAGRELGLICNNPGSTCWQLASNRLPILAGPEYGNATKTYTNSTAATIIATTEMLGLPWQKDAECAAVVFTHSLDRIFEGRAALEAFCRGAANIEVIGRGAGFSAAIMSALTIREMSGFRAAAHTGAGFRHGLVLDVDGSHVAMIFAFGRTAALGAKLTQECNRRGGKVVLVSEEDRESTEMVFAVKIDAVPEPWEAITSLLVAQALTLAMVERTGCRLPPRFQYGVMEQ